MAGSALSCMVETKTQDGSWSMDALEMPPALLVRATLYGSTAGVFLMAPFLLIGGIQDLGDAGVALFLLGLGILGAYTGALLRTTERARWRRAKARLRTLQGLHEEGLLRDAEYEARRARVLEAV